MYCPECGSMTSGPDRFCRECGASLAITPIAGTAGSPVNVVAPNNQQPRPAPRGLDAIAREDPTAWPWARFLGRQIDLVIESAVISVTLYALFPSFLVRLSGAASNNQIILGVFLLPLVLLLDAVILAILSTTPGKWAAGIRVRSGTGRLSLWEAVKRNGGVYLWGMGFGIPLVSLFTMAFSARALRLGHLTRWDKGGHFTVQGARLSWPRWTALVVCWVSLYAGLFVVGQLETNDRGLATAATSPIQSAGGAIPQSAESGLTSASIPTSWRNPVTGREAMIPAGWVRAAVAVSGVEAFAETIGNHFVMLGHEDAGSDLAPADREFLARYLDALERANGGKWGRASFELVGRVNSRHPAIAWMQGRVYRNVILNGDAVDVDVNVWNHGGRTVWRTIQMSKAGIPASNSTISIVESLQDSSAP